MTELEPQNPSRSTLSKPAGTSPRPASRRRGALNITVIAISTGLIATLALPAYASTQSSVSTATEASKAQLHFVEENAQHLVVTPAVASGSVDRDAYTTTSPVQAKAATVKSAAAVKRAVAISPALPAFSLDSVAGYGLQFVGVPYVYGGATPAGFDCSGFVMYVYAHFGVSLPHDARAQGNAGTVISQADARPGDLAIFYGGSHDGIYMGNNMVLDAPRPGGFVGVREIWTSNVFFVRIGI